MKVIQKIHKYDQYTDCDQNPLKQHQRHFSELRLNEFITLQNQWVKEHKHNGILTYCYLFFFHMPRVQSIFCCAYVSDNKNLLFQTLSDITDICNLYHVPSRPCVNESASGLWPVTFRQLEQFHSPLKHW